MSGNDINLASGSVTTTGGDGAATGSGTVACQPGWLHSVQLDYAGTAPGTTDVTLTQTASPTALLTVTDSATDATYYPRAACVDTSATAITDSHTPLWVHGSVAVAVAGCNALAPAVTVYITTRG